MPSIDEYVRAQLAAGYSISDIRAALLSSGWKEADANGALAQAQAIQFRAAADKRRALIGAPLAILAGLAIIVLFPDISYTLSSFSASFPPLLDLSGAAPATIAYGIGMIAGGALVWKGRKAGGGLVIVLALLYFLFGGDILVSVVALVAGILGVKGR